MNNAVKILWEEMKNNPDMDVQAEIYIRRRECRVRLFV